MKTIIEKHTQWNELTDEQQKVIDTVHLMIRELEDVLPAMREAFEYNDPTLGGFHPPMVAGYRYNITINGLLLDRIHDKVKRLFDDYVKAVQW